MNEFMKQIFLDFHPAKKYKKYKFLVLSFLIFHLKNLDKKDFQHNITCLMYNYIGSGISLIFI